MSHEHSLSTIIKLGSEIVGDMEGVTRHVFLL